MLIFMGENEVLSFFRGNILIFDKIHVLSFNYRFEKCHLGRTRKSGMMFNHAARAEGRKSGSVIFDGGIHWDNVSCCRGKTTPKSHFYDFAPLEGWLSSFRIIQGAMPSLAKLLQIAEDIKEMCVTMYCK